MENQYRGIITIKHDVTNRGKELAKEMIILLASMAEVKDIISTSHMTCYYIFFESNSEIDVNTFYNNKALAKYIADEDAMQAWIDMSEAEASGATPPIALQTDELRIVLYSKYTDVFNVYAVEWEHGSDTFPALDDVCDFDRADIYSIYNLLKDGESAEDILLKYSNMVDAKLKQAKKDRRMDYTKTFAKREARYFYIESVIESFKLNEVCKKDAINVCEAVLALLD